jgi:Zn-dependent protease with chaperone function
VSDRFIIILVLYSLASFAVLLAIGETAIWLLRHQAIRLLERLRPNDGVIAHLVVRYLPLVLALILTLLSAVPGYLHAEPMGTQERPGTWLIGLALLGIYALIAPIAGVAWLAIRTTAKTKKWARSSVHKQVFSGFQLFDLDIATPVIVASGVFRKSIFLSLSVRALLSARELRAALRHEAAHCRQNHNFAKLLAALAPQLFSVPELLEASFRETIEYSADDEACKVPGDALNLASAVVILAKQATVNAASLLYTALVDAKHSASLERRVERLVLLKTVHKNSRSTQLAAAYAALLGATAAIALLPSAQHMFRETLELLVR